MSATSPDRPDRPAPPFPFSVRVLLGALFAAAAALTLVAAAALVVSNAWMDRAAVATARGIERVRAIEDIRAQVRQHNRESYLFAVSGAPEHAAARDEAAAEVQRALAEARRQAADARERSLFDRLRAAVEANLAAQTAAEAVGPPPAERHRTMAAGLDTVTAAAEALIALSLKQANVAKEDQLRWNRAADVVGATVGLLLLAMVAGVAGVARRGIYRPILALRDAIARYGAGDASSRAPRGGPAELDAIAEQFNGMAISLARQREAQFRFLAAVAHDLRHPLAALKLVAELRARDAAAPDAHFALMRRQVDRLDRMIDDLLDVSRIEAGESALHPRPHDARDLAREAVELFRSTTSRHEIALSLPPDPLPLRCDGSRIAQVLNNLLSNALKYSPAGAAVRVAVERVAGAVVFVVADHGVGIAAEDRERIFEPFHRLSSSRESVAGAGLGLWVTRRIVEAHAGRIEIESAPGAGATFRVVLPDVAPSPRARDVGPASADPPLPHGPDLN